MMVTIQCDVEEVARWRRRLALQVPAERADEVRKRHLNAFAGRANLKGFRPGKAPRHLV